MPDFDRVYMRNIKRVYRLCYAKLGHRMDAEDAAQNVFLRWLRSGKNFDGDEHEKAYFLRAAHNECVNIKLSIWRTRRVEFEDLAPELISSEDETGYAEIAETMRRLPEKYREVLYLACCEGLKTAEIAAILRRNESTVRTQLQKARELMRKMLIETEEM